MRVSSWGKATGPTRMPVTRTKRIGGVVVDGVDRYLWRGAGCPALGAVAVCVNLTLVARPSPSVVGSVSSLQDAPGLGGDECDGDNAAHVVDQGR